MSRLSVTVRHVSGVTTLRHALRYRALGAQQRRRVLRSAEALPSPTGCSILAPEVSPGKPKLELWSNRKQENTIFNTVLYCKLPRRFGGHPGCCIMYQVRDLWNLVLEKTADGQTRHDLCGLPS